MTRENVGLCSRCRARVPADFFVRDSQVWIWKECPEHGRTESLVSNDAKAWYAKREMWQYLPEPQGCTLLCEKCRIDHHPNVVFVDVTNHCNMNCPICIATIKEMGYDFNPPLEYFDKVFRHFARWDPRPMVQLFGGEPTMRDDLFEIIALARKYRLQPNVTTNGLRLADEEYCKQFCASRIPVRLACDGLAPEVYEKLRHNRPAYEKKVKALANLKKHSKTKQMILSCFAYGINDQYMAPLIQYIHDNRDWIFQWAVIPLAETWDPAVFKGVGNTPEDAERMVRESVPGGGVEFIPGGLSYAFRAPRRFFRSNPRSELLLLAGVHPNCESMTVLVSDGKRYHGINEYLKVPFSRAAVEFASICRQMEPRLGRLDHTKFFQRLRGQWLIVRRLTKWGLRTFRLWKICEGNPPLALAKLAAGKMRRKWASWFSKDDPTTTRRRRKLLVVAMFPFEEQHSVDAGRLEHCKSAFAYEDTSDGTIKTVPACMWPPYRNVFLKQVAEKYGAVDFKGRPRVTPAVQAALSANPGEAAPATSTPLPSPTPQG
jgi:7,8-dihydro-6-hydroxymethylpterin dimethyltransferase